MEAGVVAELVLVLGLELAALAEVTDIEEVAHFFVAAVHIDVDACLRSPFLEVLAVYVAVGEEYGVGAALVHINHVGGVRQLFLGVAVVQEGFVAKLGELPRVYAGGTAVELLHAVVGSNAYLRLAGLASAGGDEYHAVCAAHTEHCGCRCVLKDRNGLYFVGVER